MKLTFDLSNKKLNKTEKREAEIPDICIIKRHHLKRNQNFNNKHFHSCLYKKKVIFKS